MREIALRVSVEGHPRQTGDEYTPAELAAELGAEPEAVLRALEHAVKAGTVTELNGRYRAAQRDGPDSRSGK